MTKQYVFKTNGAKSYRFPTHTNELVVDRSQADWSEVFVVVLEPGQAPPLHQHDDTEQVFYIVEGRGTFVIGEDEQPHAVTTGDVVRVPAKTPHSLRADAGVGVRYIAIDSFGPERDPSEPTWDAHVQAVCNRFGWDFDSIRPQ